MAVSCDDQQPQKRRATGTVVCTVDCFEAIPPTEHACCDGGEENSLLTGRNLQQNQAQCERPSAMANWGLEKTEQRDKKAEAHVTPLPVSGGKGLPSQESGDAGFSADMKHNFSDDFTNKLSSVRPMLKEASEIAACQVMRKELLQPLAFKCEPTASAEEEVTNLTMRKQSSHYPEEQPFQRKMARDLVESFASRWPKGKARKIMQKKHRRVSERGGTANRQSRKQWKSFHRLCCCILALGLVDVCEASAGNLEPTSGLKNDEASSDGSTCFTCMDKDMCPNLKTIYAKEDILVYVRSTAEIPKCSGAPLITKNCSVCWFQSDVIINCPKNISKFDVEESNGSTISNIVKGCKQQKKSYPPPNGSANKGSRAQSHTGIICSVVAFLMVPSLSSW